ncbi:S1 family peptidase [Pseudodesulfovibrio sp.]|uniref:S1 family peptidase n=1 Tax=unclassified Pseudodesulfovibrio TaxID=2661612 RepID=UPI003B0046A3
MLTDVNIRYKNACMGLYKMDANEQLVFLGTAFLVHPEGYLLTVAQAVISHENLMVVPVPTTEEFMPVSHASFRAIPVRVAQINPERDIALLAIDEAVEINMPDHVIGTPETTERGTALACLGFAFGFQCIYRQVLQQAVVSAKILSANDTRLFLFDNRVPAGSRGAPLINVEDLRVVGVTSGRFDSLEASPADSEQGMPTGFSYAVSIEYGAELMEKEGLEVS